jgi:hypothetical protein
MGQFAFGLLAGIIVGLVMEWVIDWTGLLPKRAPRQTKKQKPLTRSVDSNRMSSGGESVYSDSLEENSDASRE